MITIEGETVSTTSPEGTTASMPLVAFLEKVSPAVIHTGEDIIPDGVKAIRTIGNRTFVVHESSPQVYNIRWIANDSPAPFGKSATYRNVRIALPYMVIIAAFDQDQRLTTRNECFFRTDPITKWSDKLLFPGLLNCSAFAGRPAAAPLSWICTQHLNFSKVHAHQQKMRHGLSTLYNCLVGTGFNLSSENHEGSSWYNESKGIDKRIATVEKWEEATVKDPLFTLDVPWIPTELTLAKMCERMAAYHEAGKGRGLPQNAEQLAKHLFGNRKAL